jgi:hypothetical protein
MKKVISVATTAAMTLSMLSVPAMICSAAEDAASASAASFVLKDQLIAKGLDTFTVPVSLSKSTTITSAELKLSTKIQFGGSFKAVVSGVESKVEGLTATSKDNTVTFAGSADVKKGQTIANVIVKIIDKNGNAASAIPENTSFVLSMDSAKIGETAATSADNASVVLFVGAANKTDSASFTLASVNTTSKTDVKVPVTLNGSFASVNTRFRATNGAKIKSIELKNKNFELTEDAQGCIFAPLPKAGDTDVVDTKFDNEVIAELTVELPEDAVSGQSFQIVPKFIDAANAKQESINLGKVEVSDIIYVMKGDTNLSNKIEQVDATYILREALELDVNKKTLLPSLWEQDKVLTNNDEVAATVDSVGIEKLLAAVQYAVDSNADEKVNPADATYILRYLLDKGVDAASVGSFDSYVETLNKK